jgi:hypothetical protein
MGIKIAASKCTLFQNIPTKDSWYMADHKLRLITGNPIPLSPADGALRYLRGHIKIQNIKILNYIMPNKILGRYHENLYIKALHSMFSYIWKCYSREFNSGKGHQDVPHYTQKVTGQQN